MTLNDIAPSFDQRGAILGMSGCGKSNLAKALIYTAKNIPVIIDPKREWKEEGYQLITKGKDFPRRITRPLLFKPNKQEFDNPKIYNRIYEQIYDQGNLFVYTDEVTLFCTANSCPQFFKALYHQGRSKGIEVLSATQRPSGIPQSILSESQRFYCFPLNVPDDIKKVRSIVPGYDPLLLEEYEFYYYYVLRRKEGARKLKISKEL